MSSCELKISKPVICDDEIVLRFSTSSETSQKQETILTKELTDQITSLCLDSKTVEKSIPVEKPQQETGQHSQASTSTPSTPSSTPQISHKRKECSSSKDEDPLLEPNEKRPNFKNSRAIRRLKMSPQPQPHVCIADKTLDGRNVFINVLSWQRVVKPKQPLHPIPLYGGMRVYSSNIKLPIFPHLIYAVTANPDVLKKTGRFDANAQAQDALMCLMIEFVEAMNPDIQLIRQPVILPDRDVTGELKDIWLAIQAKRDSEKYPSAEMFYEEFGPESAPSPIKTNGTKETTSKRDGEIEENIQSIPSEPKQIKKNDSPIKQQQLETPPPNIKLNPEIQVTCDIPNSRPVFPTTHQELLLSIINSKNGEIISANGSENIDFSINPYLVPYPSQDLDALVKLMIDNLEKMAEEHMREREAKKKLEEEEELNNSSSKEEEEAIEPKQDAEVIETITQTEEILTQEQETIDSAKKKDSTIIPNGKSNFFSFKSLKNNSPEVSSMKKKDVKEKGLGNFLKKGGKSKTDKKIIENSSVDKREEIVSSLVKDEEN